MTDHISHTKKFAKIEELHEIILPILERSTEHLHKSESPMEFQSLTHQIMNLIQGCVNIDMVIQARSLSPKNEQEKPILHYHTQHLFDSGYVAKTILGIRKITEDEATAPHRAVYSFPTLLFHLKSYREYLDIEGWTYLVALSQYPYLSTHGLGHKIFISKANTRDTSIYTQITTYRPIKTNDKDIKHGDGVSYFLSDLKKIISVVGNRYKHAADKIYAHAADRQTWGSADNVFIKRTFAEYSTDILLLMRIHHMLYVLIIGNDICYTAHPMSYGLAENFNLSSESVKHVNNHEHQFCNNIRNMSIEAEQMLRDLPRFQEFVTIHKT
jgi:hypothetical protein